LYSISQADFQWTLNASAGGSRIVTYQSFSYNWSVQSSSGEIESGNSGANSLLESTAGQIASFHVKNLLPGNSYTVSVTANNAGIEYKTTRVITTKNLIPVPTQTESSTSLTQTESSTSLTTSPTISRVETPIVQPVVATETSTVSSSPAATTKGSVTGGQTTPTTAATPSVSPRPVSETSLEGQDEDPRGSLTVRRTDNGRYRIALTTNLESEDVVIRATKKGAKTIRFQVTLNEDGRAVILTSRNLVGYRLALIFGEDSLDSVRAT